jgi:predicted nuclease with TOPRIM domain
MESQKSANNMERLMDKIIDMVELNQRIVDEMVKANTGLREDLSLLVAKMDKLQDSLSNFIQIVEEAGKEEIEDSEAIVAIKNMVKPLVDSINATNEKLIRSNDELMNNLAVIDKRLKRIQPAQSHLNLGTAPAPQASAPLPQPATQPAPPQRPPGQ